jgi:uronate dehydrogenase
MKVLITGAAGRIGTVLTRGLQHELRLTDVVELDDPRFVRADLTDADAVERALDGVDAVVHLGAVPDEAAFEAIAGPNLHGPFHVFDACRRLGVKRIVYASSNHATGMHPVGEPLTELSLPRPDGLYGVSKVYGEAVGRYFQERFGIRSYNLRIGTVRADDDPRDPSVPNGSFWLGLTPEQKYDRMRATWLSQRDCAELIAACIAAKQVPFAIVYGISNNPRQFWDLSHAKELLGWEPKDSAPVV